MTRRRSPSEVSSSRIDQAAARPHPDLPGSRLADDAILANPHPNITDAQRREYARIQAATDKDAARGVARWSMRDAHGCSGGRCRSAAHAGDREVRDELIEMLGIGEAS